MVAVMMDRAIYTVADALWLPIADKSVHMIATSPPYWGLRSYDTGDQKHAELGAEPLHDCLAWARGDDPCGGCYVCNMRTWAREMWRVLRDDGVMFLNLGDSYATGTTAERKQSPNPGVGANNEHAQNSRARVGTPDGLKTKDLVGIPWRVALALQADGWYLRSDIIWAKPNPMPESVTDRPTKAHEYIFLLTKSARYFWDAEAVRMDVAPNNKAAQGKPQWFPKAGPERINGTKAQNITQYDEIKGANLRTVWNIATAPYAGSHFATFPPALVERMIKAGTSERGVCPECGKPWERVVEKPDMSERPTRADASKMNTSAVHLSNNWQGVPKSAGQAYQNWRNANPNTTTGWRPTCTHDAAPVPATVLDPFCGSGTTLLVARQLGRIGLGFDLSRKYLEENAAVRLGHDKLAAWGNGIKDTADYGSIPLFTGVTS